MNEIAKKATAERFLKALQKEGISKSEAGANIGLIAAQVSYLFNEKYWERLGIVYWEKVLAWVNSGYSLTEYPRHHPEAALKPKGEMDPADDEITEVEFEDLNKQPPPVGLRPRQIVDELRRTEIAEAILRYSKAYMPIPQLWIDELVEINNRLI